MHVLPSLVASSGAQIVLNAMVLRIGLTFGSKREKNRIF
jgi:hypothetical protein